MHILQGRESLKSPFEFTRTTMIDSLRRPFLARRFRRPDFLPAFFKRRLFALTERGLVRMNRTHLSMRRRSMELRITALDVLRVVVATSRMDTVLR